MADRATTRGVRRVEMVLPALIAGGMASGASRLAMALQRRGLEVGITCLLEDGLLAPSMREHGIAVATVPEPGFLSFGRPSHVRRQHGVAVLPPPDPYRSQPVTDGTKEPQRLQKPAQHVLRFSRLLALRAQYPNPD